MFGMSLTDILIRIFALSLSLSFHEAAHAWAAYKLGDMTAAEQGRLSLNPLHHLDPMGTLAVLVAGVGWARPVPVNPVRFDRKYSIQKGMLITAVAGPIANLILAAISMFIYQLCLFGVNLSLIKGADLIVYDNLLGLVFSLLFTLINMNIGLAFFNLLPVPPLDGSRIFGAILPKKYYFKLMQYERYIGAAFLFLILFGKGVIGNVIYYISYPFRWLITTPLEAFFGWLISFFI